MIKEVDLADRETIVEIFSWVKTSTPPALSTKSRKTNEYILCYEKNWNKTIREFEIN